MGELSGAEGKKSLKQFRHVPSQSLSGGKKSGFGRVQDPIKKDRKIHSEPSEPSEHISESLGERGYPKMNLDSKFIESSALKRDELSETMAHDKAQDLYGIRRQDQPRSDQIYKSEMIALGRAFRETSTRMVKLEDLIHKSNKKLESKIDTINTNTEGNFGKLKKDFKTSNDKHSSNYESLKHHLQKIEYETTKSIKQMQKQVGTLSKNQDVIMKTVKPLPRPYPYVETPIASQSTGYAHAPNMHSSSPESKFQEHGPSRHSEAKKTSSESKRMRDYSRNPGINAKQMASYQAENPMPNPYSNLPVESQPRVHSQRRGHHRAVTEYQESYIEPKKRQQVSGVQPKKPGSRSKRRKKRAKRPGMSSKTEEGINEQDDSEGTPQYSYLGPWKKDFGKMG